MWGAQVVSRDRYGLTSKPMSRPARPGRSKVTPSNDRPPIEHPLVCAQRQMCASDLGGIARWRYRRRRSRDARATVGVGGGLDIRTKDGLAEMPRMRHGG